MRRQARNSVGGARVVRSASALQVWLWLLLFVFQNEFRISRSIQPGYLDFDNLPETNFTCAGKVIGGYYADLETSCQMFHVCTVGQQDEPMDIKFLCLNGTVFDQETRVCERVDEVDCTKSEKFYSLNLELYGSTAPPIIQTDPTKPPLKPTEQSRPQTKPSTTDASDPFANEPQTTSDKNLSPSIEIIDSTEDPIQEIKKDDQKITSTYPSLPSKQQELNEEYEEDEESIDEENPDYEEEYIHTLTTTIAQSLTTTSSTTKKPTTSTVLPQSTTYPTTASQFISSPLPSISSLSPPIHSSYTPSIPPSTTLDPALLSPQEFIYRHREPGSEAVSFQRQSFRPADGVFITHAPPHQYDHFQYESSRTAPRPVAPRPVPFVQRPQPTPFRPTTNGPREQVIRISNSQSSDRLETSIKHRPQPFPSQLPPQQQLSFNPFYYDRKRSDDSLPENENESMLSARSVAPPVVKEKSLTKPKSPPRVIVTASASVSDSTGKRLNYTVGNVVSAVKPIVPINYDDYKESDLIFDPFFLDVPKLQSRRKTRSSIYKKVVTIPAPINISEKVLQDKTTSTTLSPVTSRATTIEITSTSSTTTTTAAWNPEDYVDDNYEPHAYIPPIPPLAVLVTNDQIKYKKHERPFTSDVVGNKIKEYKPEFILKQETEPTSIVAHTISSQGVGTEATVPVTSPTPIEAPTCITSRSTDCRIRA